MANGRRRADWARLGIDVLLATFGVQVLALLAKALPTAPGPPILPLNVAIMVSLV